MSKYYFDEKAGNSAVKFIETYCSHTKGELYGKPLKLLDYQKNEIIKPLFGWKNKDGTRRYRTAFIFLPRKNGKSTLGASIILTLLYMSEDYGHEFYSCANSREQSKIVFDCAKQMIENNKKLNKFVEIYKNSIVYNAKGSFYKPLSKETGTIHGLNTSAFIYDELHSAKGTDENLWDVVHTSTGSRKQPLSIAITTSGYDKETICYKMYDYAKKVKEGVIKDDQFLSVIYEANEDDDITCEKTWKKANPSYGVTLKKDYIKRESEKASKLPSALNTFKRLHLNIWTGSDIAFIPDVELRKCNGVYDDSKLIGQKCWGGLDLSSTRDLSSFVLHFYIDEMIIVKHWTFLPEEKMNNKASENDGVNYIDFEENLYVTSGNVIDHRFIENKIVELSNKYNIQSVAFDRWMATPTVLNLQEKGINMSAFGMGFKSLSPSTKELETKIMKKEFIYNNCKLLRWQFSNIHILTDNNGSIKPTKQKSTGKIDTVMALIMSVGERIFSEEEVESKYKRDNKGFFII